MKKVLLVLPSFQHGGTVRSARSFVEKNDNKKCTIDVFCLQRIGQFEKYFKKCKILKSEVELECYISLSTVFKNYSFTNKIKALFYYIKRKIFKYSNEFMYNKISKKITKRCKYDCVLAFQEGLATDFARYIPVNNRIAWVRCDYSRYYKMTNIDETEIYMLYNSIVCVSEYTASIFKKYLPRVQNKVYSIHNLIDFESIILDSNKKIVDSNFDNSYFTMISIGRIDPVKQFVLIPDIAYKLKAKGYNFYWYILGDGGKEKDALIDKINELKVNDCVILLGSRENPYPYILKSDLLVCLSSSEACPNVINEAKILHKPIVSNSFPSVYEFIENGNNGLICEINQMFDILENIITNPHIIEKISNNLSNYIYDNKKIMKSIYDLILEE